MTIYLDANVVVSFILGDSLTLLAEQIIGSANEAYVSDFGVAECVSAISRRM